MQEATQSRVSNSSMQCVVSHVALAILSHYMSVVTQVKPNILIGLTGQRGLFTPEILRLMAEYNERPIIFAMSNPTSRLECTAEEAQKYTGEGIALNVIPRTSCLPCECIGPVACHLLGRFRYRSRTGLHLQTDI